MTGTEPLMAVKINNDGVKDFYSLDFVKLLNSPLLEGDEVLIPLSIRDKVSTFWETGGKNPSKVVSAACLVATDNDTIPDAIIFGKLYRSANRRQALIALKPGYKIYAGKASHKNALDPKIKILQLRYLETENFEHGSLGRFVIDKIFRTYQDIVDNRPAERLFDKLFAKNVLRPYFANGWSITNLNKLNSRDYFKDQFIRLMGCVSEIFHHTNATEFLDAIEEEIVKHNIPRLSSAIQWVDFYSGIVGIKPLLDLKLTDIDGTLERASVASTFTIEIKDLIGCYNPKILFNSTDLITLEKMLEIDSSNEKLHAISLGHRIYGVLRSYQG